ncbi:hypothetical protein LINPERHAP2_LOCUS10894 [Linum perenne]
MEGGGGGGGGGGKVPTSLFFGDILIPFFPHPPFWFRKSSTQGSYFKAISGVFPYPSGSCKKIRFHIELQIYAIGIGWLLLAPPLRTARASSPAYGSSGEGPFLRAW